jgi:uncharacterized membrane protein YsdA (DUF1294 family)
MAPSKKRIAIALGAAFASGCVPMLWDAALRDAGQVLVVLAWIGSLAGPIVCGAILRHGKTDWTALSGLVWVTPSLIATVLLAIFGGPEIILGYGPYILLGIFALVVGGLGSIAAEITARLSERHWTRKTATIAEDGVPTPS